MFAQADLYIAVAVRANLGGSSPPFTLFARKQRLLAAPFAARAAAAKNSSVSSNLGVVGNVTVGGTLFVQGASVADGRIDLTRTGNISGSDVGSGNLTIEADGSRPEGRVYFNDNKGNGVRFGNGAQSICG